MSGPGGVPPSSPSGNQEIWKYEVLETARFGNLGSGSLETSGSGKSGPAGLGNSIGEKGQTEQILGQFGKSWGGVLAEAPKLMHGRVGAIRVIIRMGMTTTT